MLITIVTAAKQIHMEVPNGSKKAVLNGSTVRGVRKYITDLEILYLFIITVFYVENGSY